MKKVQRFLQVLLFINFMVGLHNEMRHGNLVMILVNGALVLIVIKQQRRKKRAKIDEEIL